MAVEIVTLHWCDVCKTRDGIKTEAISSTVITAGEVTRSLELCEECSGAPIKLSELGDYLRTYGTPPPPPGKRR